MSKGGILYPQFQTNVIRVLIGIKEMIAAPLQSKTYFLSDELIKLREIWR